MKKQQTGIVGALTRKQSTIHACHEQIKFLSSHPAYLLAFKEKNRKNFQTGITQPQKGMKLWLFAEMWMDLRDCQIE